VYAQAVQGAVDHGLAAGGDGDAEVLLQAVEDGEGRPARAGEVDCVDGAARTVEDLAADAIGGVRRQLG
jgi:hypothetical protein